MAMQDQPPAQPATNPQPAQQTEIPPAQDNVPIREKMGEEADSKLKEMLRKIKAAMDIWSTQNTGKIPEMEDIFEMLKPRNPDEIDPSEPRILNFRLYYGKSSQNPLYYFDPTTDSFFCTQTKQWLGERPPVCEHLNERGLGTTDVFDAILHGVMDDQDYDSLEKMNLIDDRSRQLWKKLTLMHEQTQQMMKSLEATGETTPTPSEAPQMPKVANPEVESSSGSNAYEEIKRGAGVSGPINNDAGTDSGPGQNVLAEIMKGGTEGNDDVTSHHGAGFDEAVIRRIVKEEIARALGRAIEPEAEPTTQPENAQTEPDSQEIA